jgi:hypothetical protein
MGFDVWFVSGLIVGAGLGWTFGLLLGDMIKWLD